MSRPPPRLTTFLAAYCKPPIFSWTVNGHSAYLRQSDNRRYPPDRRPWYDLSLVWSVSTAPRQVPQSRSSESPSDRVDQCSRRWCMLCDEKQCSERGEGNCSFPSPTTISGRIQSLHRRRQACSSSCGGWSSLSRGQK